jgi:hypothetical protein
VSKDALDDAAKYFAMGFAALTGIAQTEQPMKVISGEVTTTSTKKTKSKWPIYITELPQAFDGVEAINPKTAVERLVDKGVVIPFVSEPEKAEANIRRIFQKQTFRYQNHGNDTWRFRPNVKKLQIVKKNAS